MLEYYLIRNNMSKIFALVDTSVQVPSTSTKCQTVTNWKLCIICQEETKESLTCPSKSKRKDLGSGYSSLALQLIRFNELNQLPFQLERLDERCGIEMAMVANHVQYHQSCRLQYNNTKLQRVEKKIQTSESKSLYTHRRLQGDEKSVQNDICFFCGQPSGTSGLHEAATFQLDSRVRSCAVLLEDTELLAKFSTADLEAKNIIQNV